MRYPLTHKAEIHKHIVSTASMQLRKHGVNGIGLAQLMKEAGMTHGGFYAHFKSKDVLNQCILQPDHGFAGKGDGSRSAQAAQESHRSCLCEQEAP